MIADILPKLEKVKAGKAQGQWLACCPAHQDRNPSLSIRELQDGHVLLHCWSGCDTRDIVGAIRLDLRCLYPPTEPETIPSIKPAMPHWKKKQFQAAYRFEQLIIGMFTADVKANRFNVDDLNRFFLACERIRKIEGALYE